MNTTVVIVGAGPTGLAAANLLGQAGIDTLVLERNPGLSSFARAIALDDEGLRICQSLGLRGELLAHALLNLEVHYLSRDKLLAKVAPTTQRNGYPFTSTFYQPEFEEILLRGLLRFSRVHIRFSHSVETCQQSAEHVLLTVRTPDNTLQEISCDYLLACDGGKSDIRHALNIPMRGMTFSQPWLVLDSIHDPLPTSVATFYCDPQRPAMTILAPQQRRRWEFMLLPGEKDDDMLREERITSLLQQLGCTYTPQITRKAIYTFHAALATTFSSGRIFLLGDAAHLMPPFGGQGMNSGLRDAHNLCWKLAFVIHKQAAPQLLSTYQQERSPHVASMIRFSSFLGSVIMPTSRPLALLRDIILRTLNAFPITRKAFTEAAIKPAPRYKRGAIVRSHTWRSKRLTGLLLPQPTVITADNQPILLDDILGPGFAIIRCHHDPTSAFANLTALFWQQLDARFICIQPHTQGENTLASSHSSNLTSIHHLHIVQTDDTKFLRLCRDRFVVVRPDRFVMGSFEEKDMGKFEKVVQTLLHHGN